jgi:hypothetical protein
MMKEQFLKKWSNWWSLIKNAKQINEAFARELNELIEREVELRESVHLTENQIAELANIGSQHLYLGAMDERRLSYGGVLEILKKYKELKVQERSEQLSCKCGLPKRKEGIGFSCIRTDCNAIKSVCEHEKEACLEPIDECIKCGKLFRR